MPSCQSSAAVVPTWPSRKDGIGIGTGGTSGKRKIRTQQKPTADESVKIHLVFLMPFLFVIATRVGINLSWGSLYSLFHVCSLGAESRELWSYDGAGFAGSNFALFFVGSYLWRIEFNCCFNFRFLYDPSPSIVTRAGLPQSNELNQFQLD